MGFPVCVFRFWLILCLAAIGLLSGARSLADDLSVLDARRSGKRVTMLRDYLRPQVHEALTERRAAFEERKTAAEIAAWQEALTERFVASLGGFPERTPLRARVVGKLDGRGHRCEKIIFESRPGFFVTAVLYLPESKSPHPAVLFPCGHSENGKAAGSYQRACILLAQNGLAVLCYDPVGQGERKQILARDESGKPIARGRFRATSEHTICGVAPILLGENLATYRIWDGMRAMDYLASREDIDAARIGCTGNSGGGLMTSYLMALEPRIRAAAPGCFITTTRRKNESPGPGDAEQNIFAQTACGLDHPDLIMLAAPKPVLICAATRDFVPIEGTWEAFREAKRGYARLAFSKRIGLIEADQRHGFTRPLREGMVRWMSRWLRGVDEALQESVFPIHSEDELRCTSQGQVLLLDGARSLHDLYREKAEMLAAKRREAWEAASASEKAQRVREVAGIRAADEIATPPAELAGEIRRKGYRIEKLILEPEAGIVLPALYFVPEEPTREATLYVHGDGKHADAGKGGPIEQLVRDGQHVLSVDLRGYGETETTPWRFSAEYAGPNAAEYFIAYMLGRSLAGMRAEDVLSARHYLAARSPAKKINLVAVGRAGVPALHAAATARDRFVSLTLRQAVDRWQRVVETPVTIDQLENTVHGALRTYDLPNLFDLYGRSRATIENPCDAAGEPLRPQSQR